MNLIPTFFLIAFISYAPHYMAGYPQAWRVHTIIEKVFNVIDYITFGKPISRIIEMELFPMLISNFISYGKLKDIFTLNIGEMLIDLFKDAEKKMHEMYEICE